MTAMLQRPLAAARRMLRGLQPTDDCDAGEIERWRTGFVVAIFCSVGSVFLLGLAIDNLAGGRVGMAAFDLGLAAIAVANLLYLRWSGRPERSKYGVTGILVFLFAWLLVSGGVGGTGPLWCYVFVMMLMFVHGLREGAAIVGALFAGSGVLLLGPTGAWMTAYPVAFVERFLASLFALFVMALLYEYARERAQRQIAQMSARMSRAANTDALTNLPNRRHMTQRITAEHERLVAGGAPYALIEADVDAFKAINDAYGHEAGDEVLATVAGRLRRAIRAGDLLARWGGEEFLILLPATPHAEAGTIAERLRERVADHPLAVAGRHVSVTLSIGLAEASAGESHEAVLRRTDRHMYAAKQAGRNATAVAEDVRSR